jgi:hypothetical protein
MTPDDLELFSTQDLINELVRRQTFLGIVVHSEQEARRQDWPTEQRFRVHFNGNLDHDEAARLLAVVSDHLVGDTA